MITMIPELYRIWKDFWRWLNGRASKTVVIVCVGGSVIGYLVFANIMLHDIHENADTASVKAEVAALHAEFSRNAGIVEREIKEMNERVNGVDEKVTKVILIVAAESNSDLIRRLAPYLENAATKKDIYNFVLDIEKDILRNATTRNDTVKTGYRKIQKQ